MNITTVVGARPQFVKAAVVSHTFREIGINEYLVHTGQHYDSSLSDVFFSELKLPNPDVNLQVGSGSHAAQTGAIMTRLDDELSRRELPDALLVYGDTNSTLAAALVASKRLIPLIHVESGLRSFNHHMPEELNRLITDRLSSTLFCPTPASVSHLKREGITDGVHLCGDVMYEATRWFADDATDPFSELADSSFGVVTIHRAENTDNSNRLASIIRGLGLLRYQIIFPVHPRTASRLRGLVLPANIRLVEPLSYKSLLSLVRRADVVITDSGGLQKEAAWLATRCLTLRDETEWTETLEGDWNQLIGANPDLLLAAEARRPVGDVPDFGFIGGKYASVHIAEALLP